MPRPALPNAHPTAIISDDAVLPPDVKVGPFAIIEGPVTVGPGCVIGPHAHLTGRLTLGANNQVGTGVILGAAPQHLGYKGEATALEIGDGNVFREYASVHRGMPAPMGAGVTRVGHRNFFMGGCHVAHDCVIGSDVVLANSALVAGHSVIGDRAFLSGNTALHQFCRVGRLAFISGISATSKDVPPFFVMQGINTIRGLNLVGMKRAGMPPAERLAIRKAYRILFMTRPVQPLPLALLRIESELGTLPAVRELLEFIRSSKRGICVTDRFVAEGDEDASDAA
ncbi:MAG: acyl-ACP--UDP-N-acetylglucosamine O-acyltransferase [Planctomycetes bacterium]|nr:acyl-ACP--UDP-N-acetylglucosamine O-acyltransferase [Planctomycetota bacterium]